MQNRYDRQSFPTRRAHPWLWAMSVALIAVSFMLTGCDKHFLSLDCVGASGYCGPVAPTPNPVTLAASARAITAQKPILMDPLAKQDANKWSTGSQDHGSCGFHNGAFTITVSGEPASATGTYFCSSNPSTINYRDAAIAMDVTLISGDGAGFLFRDANGGNAYEFEIGKDNFTVVVWHGGDIVNLLIPTTTSAAVHGLNQTNRLLVIAKGNNYQFFINGVFVGEGQDNSDLAAGGIAMSLEYHPNGAARYANLAIYGV